MTEHDDLPRGEPLTLAELTDYLGSELEAAEAYFRSIHEGVSASVALPQDKRRPNAIRVLAWMKHGDWGLFVHDLQKSPVPLMNASRRDKVHAAPLLDKLDDALADAGDATEAEVKRAIDAVRKFLRDE